MVFTVCVAQVSVVVCAVQGVALVGYTTLVLLVVRVSLAALWVVCVVQASRAKPTLTVFQHRIPRPTKPEHEQTATLAG